MSPSSRGAATLAGHPEPDSSVPDDAELMVRCSAGDTTALSALYDRHASIAYSVARRITGNDADAEEVVQDAFLGVWRQAARFDATRAASRTWLLAIVHHRAIDVIRRRRGFVDSLDLEPPLPARVQVADIAASVLDRMEGEDVWAAVRQLSSVQREAIELAFGRGLTHLEVARATGVPLGTAKSRVRMGLARLRATHDQGPRFGSTRSRRYRSARAANADSSPTNTATT